MWFETVDPDNKTTIGIWGKYTESRHRLCVHIELGAQLHAIFMSWNTIENY